MPFSKSRIYKSKKTRRLLSLIRVVLRYIEPRTLELAETLQWTNMLHISIRPYIDITWLREAVQLVNFTVWISVARPLSTRIGENTMNSTIDLLAFLGSYPLKIVVLTCIFTNAREYKQVVPGTLAQIGRASCRERV